MLELDSDTSSIKAYEDWSGISPSTGPIRRKRGEIVLQDEDESFLDTMKEVDTTKKVFRFSARNYWLTWSQIGNVPNSALEEKVAQMGCIVKSKQPSTCTAFNTDIFKTGMLQKSTTKMGAGTGMPSFNSMKNLGQGTRPFLTLRVFTPTSRCPRAQSWTF
jgi:hypothetical protein